MSGGKYKLDELARRAGVSPRTVRYYVQRGLLKAPAFHGKDTAYGEEHLVRLRAIRRLQDAFFPLDAIAIELERRASPELLPPALDVRPMSDAISSVPDRAREQRLRRIQLAPGLELTLAEDAPVASHELFERIFVRSRGDERSTDGRQALGTSADP